MASRVAAKTVNKAVKAAAKPKAATPKPKTTPKADTPKTVLIAENAGFKDATARTLFNQMHGKLPLATLNEVQNHVFASLRTSLVKTGRVSVPGIGTFKVGVRAARTGRNPKTGEALQIEAKNTIRFSANSGWKEEVQAFKVTPKVTKPKAAK